MKVTQYALAAAKAIKCLEKLNLDPLDKLAVLRTAASMQEHEIAAATTKLLLKKQIGEDNG